MTIQEERKSVERQQLKRLWKMTGGNISQIANLCEQSIPTIRDRLIKFKIYAPLRRVK